MKQILPHVKEIITTIVTESFLGTNINRVVRSKALRCLVTLLERIMGDGDGKGGSAVLTAHFNVTGRLADLNAIWERCYRHLTLCRVVEKGEAAGEIMDHAKRGMDILGRGIGSGGDWGVKVHCDCINSLMEEGWAMWEVDSSEQSILESLWTVGEAQDSVEELVMFGCWIAEGVKGGEFEDEEAGRVCLEKWGVMLRGVSVEGMGGVVGEVLKGVVLNVGRGGGGEVIEILHTLLVYLSESAGEGRGGNC